MRAAEINNDVDNVRPSSVGPLGTSRDADDDAAAAAATRTYEKQILNAISLIDRRGTYRRPYVLCVICDAF